MKPRTREGIVKALLRPPQPAPLGTSAQRRVRLDASAEERVAASVRQSYRGTVRPLPAGVVCAVVAGAALALSGVELVLIAMAVPLACVAGYGVVSMAKRTAAHRSAKSELELAAAFDRLVESAGELPASALERLNRIKALLPVLLCAQLPGDDAFFVRQAVARYLPDAISPYLALPAARRMEQESLLDEQLQMVEDKLAALAGSADQARLERLKQNRTFLQRKLD